MVEPVDLDAELAALHAANRDLRRANESQQRLLRALAAYAPLVLYAKDLAGRFLFSNRLHATLLGLQASEVVGKLEAELVGADAAAEIHAVTERVIRVGEASVAEFSIPLEGDERVFLEHVFPLRDEDDNVTGIGGAAIDITERKRAEESVRVLAALAEHSPDGILVVDHAGSLAANPALRRLLGLPPDAPAERALALLGGTYHGEAVLLRDDGAEVTVEVTTFAIPGASGPVATATLIHDVTALRQASRERERQSEVIRRQQADLIAELSAPLLPLAPGVLVLPLIGTLDDARAAHVREAALEAIAAAHTRVLIIDLTGLRATEEAPADRLLAFVDAVRLLGARVVMTGIRPAVAAALSDAGFVARHGLVVYATLQDAVRATLGR